MYSSVFDDEILSRSSDRVAAGCDLLLVGSRWGAAPWIRLLEWKVFYPLAAAAAAAANDDRDFVAVPFESILLS